MDELVSTIETEVSGFTPTPDAICKDKNLGFVSALIWGRVWRYAQMKGQACYASYDTLADDLGINRRTVINHVKQLVEAGYLEDLTPGLKHRPHKYKPTDKIRIRNIIAATNGVSETQPQPQESTNVRSESNSPLPTTRSESNSPRGESNSIRSESNSPKERIKDTNKDIKQENLNIREEEEVKVQNSAPPSSSWEIKPKKPISNHSGKTKEFDLYQKITGQAKVPTWNGGQVWENLTTVLEFYEWDIAAAAAAGQGHFENWAKTKNEKGQLYSRTNPGWLEWWVSDISMVPSMDGDGKESKKTAEHWQAYIQNSKYAEFINH